MNQIRQGEIWLRRVNRIPRDYMESDVYDSVLLATGETGNAHTLVGDVRWLHDAVEDINELWNHGARGAQEALFVEVFSPATIEHSDRLGHETAVVDPGVYQVTIKREQLPWEEEARWVDD